MKMRVLVIGGGVIGLATAWELAQRGASVTLIERDEVGKGTSWTAAGILPPANLDLAIDPIDRLRGLSHQMYPEWISRLESLSSLDTGFRRCGGWYLADSPGERAAMIGMTGYWSELDIECRQATAGMLIEQEPALRDWADRNHGASDGDLIPAWWVADEYQVRPPRLLQALHQACLRVGVTIHQRTSVLDIRGTEESPKIDSCPAVRVDDGSGATVWMESDRVVLCGGVWSGAVAERFQLHQSLVPVRGQMLLLQTQRPLLHSVINVGQRYVMCRDDGMTLVGSCEEEVGFQLGTTEAMLDELKSFAVDLVPELASARQQTAWSGLRPMTFDGFPMIGPVPDASGYLVAAGHFRSGIHLAPATASVTADLIMGQTPPIDLEAFRVGKQQSHS